VAGTGRKWECRVNSRTKSGNTILQMQETL